MRRKVSNQIMITIKVISTISRILKLFPSWVEDDDGGEWLSLRIPRWAYDELLRISALKSWNEEEKPHAND